MAWSSGFFNSVNGDRKYNADTINNFFEGLIIDGIFESIGDKMAVQPSSGMTIQVASGKGFFNKHWVKNTAPYQITLEQSDVTLNKYAAICIRVDESVTKRTAELCVKYSEVATNPAKPSMTRNEYVKEYCLAYIYIKAGVSTITASAITDTRNDTSLCGWVTGLIKQIDINTIYTQFTALSQEWMEREQNEFSEWFDTIQGVLDEETATMLVAALPAERVYTIETTAWKTSNGKYIADVAVTGMTSNKMVIVAPETGNAERYTDAGILAINQSAGKITLQATKKPTAAVGIRVCFMGR